MLICPQMLGELVDSLGEQGNLHFRGTAVLLKAFVLPDQLPLFRICLASVDAQAEDDADIRDRGPFQFVNDKGEEPMGRTGPGHVTHEDDRALFPLGQLHQGPGSDGFFQSRIVAN